MLSILLKAFGCLPSHPHGFFSVHLHGSQVQFSHEQVGLLHTIAVMLSVIYPVPYIV